MHDNLERDILSPHHYLIFDGCQPHSRNPNPIAHRNSPFRGDVPLHASFRNRADFPVCNLDDVFAVNITRGFDIVREDGDFDKAG